MSTLFELGQKDWDDFKEHYPLANAWLAGRMLRREYERLHRTTQRNAWQEARYQELHTLYAEWGQAL